MNDGLVGYSRKVRRNKHQLGTRHRLGCKGVESRLMKKAMNKSNWFKKVSLGDLQLPSEDGGGEKVCSDAQAKKADDDQPIAVLFIERTVKGGLATELKRVEKELSVVLGDRIRIIEKAGTKVEHLICMKDP